MNRLVVGTSTGVVISQAMDAPWVIGLCIALGIPFGQMVQTSKKSQNIFMDFYQEGSVFDLVIWIGFVAGSGLGILYYIWEYFDKKKNPKKYEEIYNFDWKKGLEED